MIDMSKLFRNYHTIMLLFQSSRSIPSIVNWDTSNVTDMSDMFQNYNAFNQPIGCWNTSKVTNMSNMFENCTSFNQPLDDWDISNVISMNGMFRFASEFNQPIGKWKVRLTTDINWMFFGATKFDRKYIMNAWEISQTPINLKLVFDGFSIEEFLEHKDMLLHS